MANSPQQHCGVCGGKGKLTIKEGIWENNPISIQILGICSALAVTTRLENSLVMGAALIFVCVGSNLFVSLLRKVTPRRIRMIAEVAIIATFVILFDQFLKAFYWEMSKQLGPYVGLIITNCIVMGRAEAFALQNGPIVSMVDGAANGLGYAAVLAIIGFFRELLGVGTVPGVDRAMAGLQALGQAAASVAGPVAAVCVAVVLAVGIAIWAIRKRRFVLYGVVVVLLLSVVGFMLLRQSWGVPVDAPVKLGDWYTPNQMMILAPGAFIALGFLIAVANWIRPPEEDPAP